MYCKLNEGGLVSSIFFYCFWSLVRVSLQRSCLSPTGSTNTPNKYAKVHTQRRKYRATQIHRNHTKTRWSLLHLCLCMCVPLRECVCVCVHSCMEMMSPCWHSLAWDLLSKNPSKSYQPPSFLVLLLSSPSFFSASISPLHTLLSFLVFLPRSPVSFPSSLTHPLLLLLLSFPSCRSRVILLFSLIPHLMSPVLILSAKPTMTKIFVHN